MKTISKHTNLLKRKTLQINNVRHEIRKSNDLVPHRLSPVKCPPHVWDIWRPTSRNPLASLKRKCLRHGCDNIEIKEPDPNHAYP